MQLFVLGQEAEEVVESYHKVNTNMFYPRPLSRFPIPKGPVMLLLFLKESTTEPKVLVIQEREERPEPTAQSISTL